MAAKILEGKTIARSIKECLKDEAESLKRTSDRFRPVLASIRVGDNPSSLIYAHSQRHLSQELGIGFELFVLKDGISQRYLLSLIERLNEDNRITGIFIQNPLPRKLDVEKVIASVNPKKDVEGIHPENINYRPYGRTRIGSCTALAVMELIEHTGVGLYGKEAVVVGNSEIVGKPVSLMLMEKMATVTVCHIGTSERGSLSSHIKRAEVLVVAVGKPELIKGEWIKRGAIVVDVGINIVHGKIIGDVEFEEAKKRAGFITPVPGGVGPLTVAMLMKNVVEAFKLQIKNGT